MKEETGFFNLASINLNGVVVSAFQNFLVIDDEGGILDVMEETLEILGFIGRVHRASSINEAKKILKYEKVDYIISDWNLPDGEGIALLKAIRRSKKFCDIPFLMVTGDDSVDSMILSSRYGGSDYLVKPFTINDFKEKLAEGWKTHIVPVQDEVHQLRQQIIALEEENQALRAELRQATTRQLA